MKSDILNFESFINHSPIIIFIWNPVPNEPVLYVSENISQFGYSQEDFLNHKTVYSDIVHPEDLPKIRSESQHHVKNQTKSFLQKYRIITKSGEIRWIFDHTWDELDKFGNTLYYYGFILDITDQIEIEQALRESEERFKIAAQNVSDVIYEYDVVEHKFIWFGELQFLLKISNEQIPETFEELSKFIHVDDSERIKKKIQMLIEDKNQIHGFLKCRIIPSDEKERLWQGSLEIIRNDAGKALKVIGVLNDITEKYATEQALRESEERFRIVASKSSDIIFEYNYVKEEVNMFGDIVGFFGVSQDEIPIPPSNSYDFIFEEDRDRVRDATNKFLASKESRLDLDYRIVRKDGSVRFCHDTTTVIRDPETGKHLKVIGALSDITEKHIIEQALRESEERFRIVAENGSDLIYEFTSGGKKIAWFGDVENFYGLKSDEIPKNFDEVISRLHPSDQRKITKQIEDLSASTKERMVLEYRIIKKDREVRNIRDVMRVIRNKSGKPIKVIGALSDITEKNKFEQILQQSESRFRMVAENTSDLIYEYDYNDKNVKTFGGLESLLGISEKELNKSPKKFYDFIHDEDRLIIEKEMVKFLASKEDKKDFTYRLVRKDGDIIYCRDNTKLIRDSHGLPQKAISAISDITQKYRYEEALKVSKERFRTVAQNVSDIIFEYDVKKHSVYWFGDIAEHLKIGDDEIPKRMTAFMKFIHPDDIERIKSEVIITRESRKNADYDFRIIRKDGKIRHWHNSVEFFRDASGKLIKVIGALSDLTHQKNIEAELEIRQRMDYIGNFAGGIAHDFNNILAVILGNVSLLQMDADHLSEEHNLIINDISTASERAKSIIKQLQEFSSQDIRKEKAEIFDLSVIVDEVINFMKNTTNRLIQKENSIPKNRYFIKGNPVEFNQVLLNLGINSIHAIEEKKNGATTLDFIKIDISFPEGEQKNTHIVVNFMDSGRGIPEKNLKQMFIPFFTTKTGSGASKIKGRGLGLSMVYHIITNKFDGSINIESRVDHGTVFYITLPLIDQH
ncbi:PAS domain-containing protein [Promethearchaeum syntrophicum]|uniref:histidine kinase n=1 Tax=Promethearchaeum syntrophicum TaxID=2594042 RepID=A0A5B9D589_9ARCH|nr:PAS domain-containing protein [Candidatus Prometheoarchaeum syntrophicum]QEE14278.1 putative diguanylate cyclase [Candidatus Prometheoarchaeum syntrophicum]